MARQQHVDLEQTLDPARERRVRRKIDLNLMPMVMALCKLGHAPRVARGRITP